MNLCTKCARAGQSCCQSVEVLLTDGDVRRVTAATGRSDFWERREPLEAYHLTPQPGDPRWLLYTVRPDRTRVQLKQLPDGDCVLLTRAGCALDRETRPLTCRLYPYDYDEQRLTGRHTACPTELLGPGEELFRAIGVGRDEAEAWRTELYEELRAGSVYRDNRRAAAEPDREQP